MSMSQAGRTRRIAIIGTRLWPPARSFAPSPWRRSSSHASATDAARVYSKGADFTVSSRKADNTQGGNRTMFRFCKEITATVLCAAQTAACAQAWPAKPIRIIVPFTPGSGTDIIARTVTERLSPQIGQPIVIENRPGASGTIGAALVAKSEPDGYTLFVHSSSYTVTPSTYKDLPYDTLRDLTGVIPLALLPNVLVIAPSKGIHSVKELVAAAKAKPGSLNSASDRKSTRLN